MANQKLWHKVTSNRLTHAFQVRDQTDRTLFGRMRWLLFFSALALLAIWLVTNRRFNLLLNRDQLEQVESAFISRFYPTYDSLYYWLQYQGNLAEAFANADDEQDFFASIQNQLATLEHVRYIQFGVVGTGNQWRATYRDDRWLLENENSQDFAVWLLSQQHNDDQIYWADSHHDETDELQLFWLYHNDQAELVYFLVTMDFTYQISLSADNQLAPGALVFLSSTYQPQIFPLQTSGNNPTLASESAQPASSQALLEKPPSNINWRQILDNQLLSTDERQRLSITPLTLGREHFWCKLVPVKTQTGYDWLAIIIQETQLLGYLGLTKTVLRILIVCLILVNLAVFIIYYWQFSRRYYFTAAIKEVIDNGENANLEFKSTLRYDLKQQALNKNLEHVILKSVAAFNNSDGGLLIIGVGDSGKILGLKNDYQTLKKQNKDGFELHLRALISQAYGEHFAARRLEIFFPSFGKDEICVVNIKKGRTPLYTLVADKNGGKVERFYIRMGNSCREIEKPSDIVAYQNERFRFRLKLSRKSNRH